MEKHKEIGYQLGDVYWNNLDGFKELWKKADFDTKEKCVNTIGKLALKLCKNNKTCNCGGSCGCGDKPKEYDKIVHNQLANLLEVRDDECAYLTAENVRLRKRKNIFRNASIILLIISIILLLMGNYLVN